MKLGAADTLKQPAVSKPNRLLPLPHIGRLMPAPDLQWSERASHDAHADLANPMALISLFSLLPMIVGLGFDPYIKGYPLGWVAVSSAFNLAIGLSAACFLHWRLKRYKI